MSDDILNFTVGKNPEPPNRLPEYIRIAAIEEASPVLADLRKESLPDNIVLALWTEQLWRRLHGLSGGELARLARIAECLYIFGNPMVASFCIMDPITEDGVIVTLDSYRDRWPGLAFVHVPVPDADEDLAVWVHTCRKEATAPASPSCTAWRRSWTARRSRPADSHSHRDRSPHTHHHLENSTMNPSLSPNDKIRRLVMVKEVEAILRRYLPPLPPQVDALIRGAIDHDTYLEAVAAAVVRHVDMACFHGVRGPISARMYLSRGAYMVGLVGEEVVNHVQAQEEAGEDPTMVVAGFKAWAQRHAQDCGFSLKDEQLDAMVADLIPEAILDDMRPARAGGKGRRGAQARPQG